MITCYKQMPNWAPLVFTGPERYVLACKSAHFVHVLTCVCVCVRTYMCNGVRHCVHCGGARAGEECDMHAWHVLLCNPPTPPDITTEHIQDMCSHTNNVLWCSTTCHRQQVGMIAIAYLSLCDLYQKVNLSGNPSRFGNMYYLLEHGNHAHMNSFTNSIWCYRGALPRATQLLMHVASTSLELTDMQPRCLMQQVVTVLIQAQRMK